MFNRVTFLRKFLTKREPVLLFSRFKSNGINVSNYETGFNSGNKGGVKGNNDESLVDELDLLSLSFEPKETDNSVKRSTQTDSTPQNYQNRRNSASHSGSPNRSQASKYPTGGVAKQRCYNCGQIGHISFDCQQPQVRKACYTCGNSGHLARECPQSQRPVICYVCRQPGHLASKCPSSNTSGNSQYKSSRGQDE